MLFGGATCKTTNFIFPLQHCVIRLFSTPLCHLQCPLDTLSNKTGILRDNGTTLRILFVNDRSHCKPLVACDVLKNPIGDFLPGYWVGVRLLCNTRNMCGGVRVGQQWQPRVYLIQSMCHKLNGDMFISEYVICWIVTCLYPNLLYAESSHVYIPIWQLNVIKFQCLSCIHHWFLGLGYSGTHSSLVSRFGEFWNSVSIGLYIWRVLEHSLHLFLGLESSETKSPLIYRLGEFWNSPY